MAPRALRDREGIFEDFFALNPSPMWICDDATLRFLAVNEAAVRHYGWSREEFLAMTATEIRPPEDVPKLLSAVAAQRSLRATSVGEWRHRRKDGTQLDVEVTVSAIQFEGRPARLTMIKDITERKQTEAALRSSEERLRLAQGAADMGTFDWDIVGGRVAWPPETERIWGLREGEFRGSYEHWRELVHPEDLPKAEALTRAALGAPDAPYEFEHRIVWPDGTVRWIYAKATTVWDAGRPVRMVGLNMDITERRRAEETLRDLNATLEERVRRRTSELVDANERFERVAQATILGIYDWDLTSGTAYFSPRWRKLRGYDEASPVPPADKWDHIHPDDRDRAMSVLRAFEAGERDDHAQEYRVRRVDGTWLWVLDCATAMRDAQGRAVRLVGAETDVTWRKAAEAALDASRREFEFLAQNVPAAFGYVDADRRYRFVNRGYEALFKRPTEQIVGTSMRERLGPVNYATVAPHVDAVLRGEPQRFEYRLELPGAPDRWIAAHYEPDRDEQGQVRGAFLLLSDVTALKQSEAALHDRERQLRELSAKLLDAQDAERRKIARDLHDDLVQRLAMLAVELDVLRRTGTVPDAAAGALAVMHAKVDRMIADTQILARGLHPAILEHRGLEAAIRELADEVAGVCGLDIEVTVRGLPHALASGVATCLYRVAQESLNNVRKHASATTVLVSVAGNAQSIRLSVHDDGCGFEGTEQIIARRGLGLTSMGERVRMLGGEFQVIAKPGDGTRVEARVPLARDESGAGAHAGPHGAAPPRRRGLPAAAATVPANLEDDSR